MPQTYVTARTITEGGYDTCLHKTWIMTFNLMVASMDLCV